MLSYFQVLLTWTQLLKRTARETQNDNGLGLAAELAYYFFLALFPALLFMGLATFIVASATLVLAGPELARLVADRVGLGTAFEWTWLILQWPLVFGLVASGIGLVYYFAPDVEQDFMWLTPGSVTATLLWLAASLGFRLYVVNFGAYNQTYGAIGAVMVLLVWLYLSALAVIVGGELNAEIEHASTHSLAAGPILSGRRRIIGARAAREFRQRQQREPASVPSAAAHVPGQRAPGVTRAIGRVGALIGGLMAALSGRRVRH